jgi:C4-type Zn-finger protein
MHGVRVRVRLCALVRWCVAVTTQPARGCQVMSFEVNCYDCSAPGETRMCMTDIPHFKEIIIMSFLCDECGFRSVEVKGGGAVPDHGTVTKLTVVPGAMR